MRTKFFATKPEDMDFTVQITMSLKKWKELREQITDSYPGWELKTAITSVVLQAQKSFEPERPHED